MKSIKVSSANLQSKVICPTSKSYANRALVLAAIEPRDTELVGMPISEDVDFMLDGLRGLGLEISQVSNGVVIKGSIDTAKQVSNIFLGEGGTTIRFFIALVSLMDTPVEFSVEPRFLKRPIDEYCDLLRKLGVEVEVKESSIKVTGPIKQGQSLEVDCSKTTQFASALELISSKAGLEIVPVNLEASGNYFEMTKKVQSDIQASPVYKVPVDYSSFGYFAAFAALTETVRVKNAFSKDPLQGDSQILDFIKDMGGDYKFSDDGVDIYPIREPKSIEVDGSGCIDLVPTLMVLMAYSGKVQKIKNIKNLEYKECDRLEEMQRILDLFEIKHEYDQSQDIFTIHGDSPKMKTVSVEAAHDHRMVMCAALLCKLNGGGEVSPGEAVKKSFGNFFNYFK
tara:strand:+ start:14669 stop:15856 length:1188 start_codon:yes stop_codon:yes gene_type:complete